MSELSKHTPAPWKINEWNFTTNGETRSEIQFGDDGECVVDCVYRLKDAQLIAAAPDMLEALKRLKNNPETAMFPSAWKRVNEAIAKAEGSAV